MIKYTFFMNASNCVCFYRKKIYKKEMRQNITHERADIFHFFLKVPKCNYL
jgi:hypothetical protein